MIPYILLVLAVLSALWVLVPWLHRQKLWLVLSIGAALAVGAYLIWPEPAPPPAPVGPPVAVETGESHVRREGGEPMPDRDTRGKLRVEVQVEITAQDTPGTIKTAVVEICIPRAEEESPAVNAEPVPGVSVTATYTDFRNPWMAVELSPMVGAGGDPAIGASPAAGLGLVTVAERFRIGAGADRFGLGPAVFWEFFREFNVGARWALVKFTPDASPASFSILYRF